MKTSGKKEIILEGVFQKFDHVNRGRNYHYYTTEEYKKVLEDFYRTEKKETRIKKINRLYDFPTK